MPCSSGTPWGVRSPLKSRSPTHSACGGSCWSAPSVWARVSRSPVLGLGDVDQYYAPVAQPEYGRALLGVLRQFRFAALEGRLDRIAAPTLVLWGEEDRWVPIGLGRALAAGITRSAFVSVPRAGHSVQEESPEDVNHLVIRFLKDGVPRVPADLAFGH